MTNPVTAHPAPVTVQHTLTDQQRARFDAALRGPWTGASIAGYLAAAYDTDHHADITGPWWGRHGITTIIRLEQTTTTVDAVELIHCALIALLIVDHPKTPDPKAVLELAVAAANWTAALTSGARP